MAEKPFALPNKEMGYLWDRGNPQPFFSLLIMVADTGYSNNSSGSGLNTNIGKSEIKSVISDKISLVDSLFNTQGNPSETTKSQKKSRADQVEDFSSNLQSKNIFSDDDGIRFFVIKRKGNFSRIFPFRIQKAIQSVVGEANSIKKL